MIEARTSESLYGACTVSLTSLYKRKCINSFCLVLNAKYEHNYVLVTATGFEPTTNYFVNEYSTSFCSRTKWFWNRVPLQSLKLQISLLFRKGSLTLRKL